MARFIDSGPGAPSWNMAVDEALLDLALDQTVLRCYAWQPFGLSLGAFQDVSREKIEAFEKAGIPATRRLTGGGAILHGSELTYSLATAKPSGGNRRLYARVNRAFIQALSSLGVEARERGGPGISGDGFECFRRLADFDLCVDGRKALGSAQRLRRGRILQHGSLPLDEPPPAPHWKQEAVPLVPYRLTYAKLVPELVRAFEQVWEEEFHPSSLTLDETVRAEALVRERYRSPEWILRRS